VKHFDILVIVSVEPGDGRAAVDLSRFERSAECLSFAITNDLDGDLISGVAFADGVHQIISFFNLFLLDLDDHIASFQSRFLRRALLHHFVHKDAGRAFYDIGSSDYVTRINGKKLSYYF
jgi:hypothetical protein|tara:strand:+ start:1118 stop:1477 length:360 start_codon:yes stop_codon:yes gene_type:complete